MTSRLEENPTRTFYLARLEDGELVPIYDTGLRYAWEYSSIRLPVRRVSEGILTEVDPIRVVELIERHPMLSEKTILLMKKDGDGWSTNYLSRRGGGVGIYTAKRGFDFERGNR